MSTRGTKAREALEKRVGPLTLSALILATREGEQMSQSEFARLLVQA